MTHCIFQGDAGGVMDSFPSNSVDLIVTSPPYDDMRTYNGHDRWDFNQIARGMLNVLKPGAIACWVVYDSIRDGCESLTSCRQKIHFVELGFKCRTIIYQKRNFSHPNKNWYHSVFEYVFVLSKGKPKTWNPLMDRPNKTAGCIGNLGVNTFTERDGSKSTRPKKITAQVGKRHNVWLGNTRGQEDMCVKLKHPAMMPKWLARDLILSFSNADEIVLDPMAGSGTTAMQALRLGRRAISIESNPDYVNQLRKQSWNPKPAALIHNCL